MWWKFASVLLILYTIVAGLRVPLKSGIQHAEPYVCRGGDTTTLKAFGYNTFFEKSDGERFRVWLTADEDHSILAQSVEALNDTVLEARFVFPEQTPDNKRSARLNLIVDHPDQGTSILPAAVEFRSDTSATAGVQETWKQSPVTDLHPQKGFSYPYQNVIYETIRNTYFHVPMWFALMFLFMGSVYYSARYLRNPDPEYDRRAAAYAEIGLLFGVLGLLTGMVWANYTWGQPWSNDIKQLMTAVALLVYLAYFILRRSFEEEEKSARLSAVYNIFAFASLIPLLYIVPRMFASLHPGATGNPAFGTQDLDSTMRAVFYPAILGWTLLGFWIAQLRFRFMRIRSRALDLE